MPRPIEDFDAGPLAKIIGVSEAIKNACKMAEAAAKYDVNILLLGETGVGKDLFARTIHELSRRRDKPFVAVNCSAIQDTLLENEIFGHEKGAFTDAKEPKKGKMELADEGTLFLDELGAMSPAAQCKLLRVLEEDKTFERVGGVRSIKVDVRIIAATNADLEKKVKEGSFRPDLFFRLCDFPIEIPPLRQRGGDVELLINHYLERFCKSLGKIHPWMDHDLLDALINYSWPGNVRELKHVLRRALIMKNGCGTDLGLNDFPRLNFNLNILGGKSDDGNAEKGPSLGELAQATVEAVEKKAIAKMLEETHWNRTETARNLGMGYKILLKKLKKWGWK